MSEKFESLDSEDVLSSSTGVFISHSTFKVNEFMKVMTQEMKRKLFQDRVGNKGVMEWFDEGISCEILKPGARSWCKGKVKVKVCLEFCPDEFENGQSKSSLDDIRQISTGDGQ